jgi:hypothetical protein
LAVKVVVPVTLVLPIATLPLLPPAATRFRVPAVNVPPPAFIEPPAAESFTVNVPLPTLDVWTVTEAVSVTAVVPEVAVALRDVAFVLEIVAPPVPVFNESVPVLTFVAAVWLMLPEPLAVRVVVPDTVVLPTEMLPLVPAVVVKLSVPAVSVPVVERLPPEAESFTVSVPVPTFEV